MRILHRKVTSTFYWIGVYDNEVFVSSIYVNKDNAGNYQIYVEKNPQCNESQAITEAKP